MALSSVLPDCDERREAPSDNADVSKIVSLREPEA